MSNQSHFPAGLTVMLIGRDEAAMLPKILPPLQGVADEILLVDTGSVDATKAVAASMGCRVLERPWDNSFARAKNFGIENSSFRWILNVDCDEELMVDDACRSALTTIKTEHERPAAIITIDHLIANGETVSQQSMRLFQNHPCIRFANPIHECVSTSVYQHWPHIRPLPVPVHLRHYGFMVSRERNQAKMQRNLSLLRAWALESPEELFCHYKLGKNLLHCQEIVEGLDHLSRAFELAVRAPDRTSYPFLGDLVQILYQSLREQGLEEQAAIVRRIVNTWS